MICPLCRGSGSQVTHQRGHRQYWTCQACGGDGASVAYGPPTQNIGRTQQKYMRPDRGAKT